MMLEFISILLKVITFLLQVLCFVIPASFILIIFLFFKERRDDEIKYKRDQENILNDYEEKWKKSKIKQAMKYKKKANKKNTLIIIQESNQNITKRIGNDQNS